ncbi:MAG: T9SS type A sorting domain-containing protein [Bacteroidota bacterium]
MKYLYFVILIFISIKILAQDPEYHQLTSDPEIREIVKEGMKLIRANTVKNNRILALQEFKKAANMGDKTAQFIVGEMYEKGVGTKKDTHKAFKWYYKSAENGDKHAMYKVGLAYKDGKVITQDFEKAVEWFQKTIDAGNPVGNYLLGYMYYKGLGVEQNYQKAFKLTEKSANADVTAGKHLLGYCYENGHGVKMDLNKAEKLYTECDKRGYGQSKVRLEKVKEKKAKANGKNKSAIITGNSSAVNPAYKEITRNQDAHSTNFGGDWQGAMHIYDWGKTEVYSQMPLKLDVKQQKFNINGFWKAGKNQSVAFSAVKVGNVLYCKNLSIEIEGAYGTPVRWVVSEGQFEIQQTEGQTYLVGNLKMHNPEINEPFRPCYIALEVNTPEEKTDTIKNTQVLSNEVSSVLLQYAVKQTAELTAYPNPANSRITIDYTVAEEGETQLSLYNTQGQLVKVVKSRATQRPGSYSVNTAIEGTPGSYIIKLVHNNQVYTKSIIKQ